MILSKSLAPPSPPALAPPPEGSQRLLHHLHQSHTQLSPPPPPPQQRKRSSSPAGDAMVTTLPDGRPLVDNTGRAIKRKRPQSCDFCRSRKTKCVRPETESLELGDLRCVQCRSAGVACTWDYVPKRPGPQTHLSSGSAGNAEPGGSSNAKKQKFDRTTNRAAPTAKPSPTSISSSGPLKSPLPSPGGSSHSARVGSPKLNGFTEASQMSAHFDNPPPNPYQPFSYGLKQEESSSSLLGANPMPPGIDSPRSSGLSPMQWPFADFRSVSQHGSARSNQPSPMSSTGRHREDSTARYSTAGTTSSIVADPKRGAFNRMDDRIAGGGQRPQDSYGPAKPKSRLLGKIFAAPIERPRSLDDVAPRATFLSIISLYFHHLYPLMPIVHQPSFSHDLITRRDERDADFLSFVLSLTAYTLIQCPRSIIPAPWPFYRKLHQICHLTSRRMQLDRHTTSDPPTLTQCATLYTTHIYMGSTSRTFAANAIHGELVRTAFSINLHDEMRPLPTASGLPEGGPAAHQGAPQITEIERQLRRRLYYLIYGSDKTISILSDEPISLRDADTVGVEIPAAVDDDLIFPHKVSEQPAERGPSILCGFEAVTKLHRIMSELVENFRADRRTPPPNAEATRAKLHFARSILYSIRSVIDEMPDVLRQPSFEHTEPPRRPSGGLPDLGLPFYQMAMANDATMGRPSGHHHGSHVDSAGNGPVPTLPGHGISASPAATLPFGHWPTGTFDEHGLPIPTDGASQTSSSAAGSPSGPWSFFGPSSGSGQMHFSLQGKQGPSRPASPAAPSTAQLNAALEQVVAFRPSPPAAGPARPQITILSGFAICRANILVTEAMLRFVLVDYQELLQGYLARQRREEEACGIASVINSDESGSNDIEEAARSFFSEAVTSLPLDALAANGQSLILKLVFIVSSLLNRTSSSSRAFAYMSEFLQTLSHLSERRTAGDEEPGSDDEEVLPHPASAPSAFA
ncbi:unnamed protein product [Parajaminaea phylloscopi]